ncbi:hypothetical protein C9974_14560 [Marinobacter sp. B9-2]|nr:hypothetical protein C9974_14560 [Marinobacter sp. B9-2]
MKKILYTVFVRNRVIDFLSSPALSMTVPPIVALYYGTLDIWGDEWQWVNEYSQVHEVIFTILATFTILVMFLKGVSQAAQGAVTKRYTELTKALIQFFNGLVKKKKDRFHGKALHLKPTADIFRKITHPKDQLEFVLDGTKTLLCNGMGIEQKNIGITIIQGNPAENKWWYMLKCDRQRQHTKAGQIMNSDSTAKYCYETGDSLFISDIRKGKQQAAFFSSDRSSAANEIGSIFCKPVRIKVDSTEFVYIFTIAVFGQHMCTPYDPDESEACERILDEVADRVELELYLHSMKEYRENGGNAA